MCMQDAKSFPEAVTAPDLIDGHIAVSYDDTCTVELAKLLHDPS
jgi:hypothetical protein